MHKCTRICRHVPPPPALNWTTNAPFLKSHSFEAREGKFENRELIPASSIAKGIMQSMDHAKGKKLLSSF